MKAVWSWIKEVAGEFFGDNAIANAAAIAFYTMFSLAPLLVISIAIAGMIFGRDAAQGAIVEQFRGTMGTGAGEMVEEVVTKAAQQPGGGVIATVIGVVTLIVGSMGVFGQLKSALNAIWDVTPKPGRGVWGFVRDHLLSFAMVLCIAFLLLVSLAVSAFLATIGSRFSEAAQATAALGGVVNFGVSFLIITALFAAMYKWLPDVKIGWRDVLLGAVLTALLFTVGKFMIGLYLGKASIVSVYGAAGSLVVILVWVYYSAIIFLFGAELTQVTARRRGSKVVPSENARWAPGEGGVVPA